MDAWKTVLNGLCDRTTAHLYSILSYQEGGFLQDPSEEEPTESDTQATLNLETRRIEELRALRRACIPEVHIQSSEPIEIHDHMVNPS